MPTEAPPQPRVQELTSIEDLGALVLGDVIKARTTFEGRQSPTAKLMAVISHPDGFRPERRTIDLAHRYSADGIYHIRLPFAEGSVVNGELCFDYKKGQCIRIWGGDVWPYDCAMHDLQKAGLE